jgi:polar amino acid transport system permease protein
MNAWNWDTFFGLIFNKFLFNGAVTTVWLTAATMFIGIIVALGIALCLVSHSPFLKSFGRFYVYVIRGTPLLVQLLILFTGLPQFGIRLSALQSALISLSVNESAYLAEILRAAIISVNKGQYEAAKALGMPYGMMMRKIIIPQTTKMIVPELGNRINGMLKFSSIAATIGVMELLRRAQMLIQYRFAVLEIYIIVSIYYLIMTTLWDKVQVRIERRYSMPTNRS